MTHRFEHYPMCPYPPPIYPTGKALPTPVGSAIFHEGFFADHPATSDSRSAYAANDDARGTHDAGTFYDDDSAFSYLLSQ